MIFVKKNLKQENTVDGQKRTLKKEIVQYRTTKKVTKLTYVQIFEKSKERKIP